MARTLEHKLHTTQTRTLHRELAPLEPRHSVRRVCPFPSFSSLIEERWADVGEGGDNQNQAISKRR
jgi:hypothetical protein